MKIDRTKLKKGTSEVPVECKTLLDNIRQCAENRDQLLNELKQVKVWIFGKCELLHWADVLDIFDDVLEKACKRETEKQWLLPCDRPGNEKDKLLLLQVLQFTSLLIEHSFTRHLYNSMEHLTTLLCSSDMTVVLGVLNLLYVFSKRSNFIMRLNPEKKKGLVERLMHLAESWGGKENGFGLAECCCDLRISSYPVSSTTLHFEFYAEQVDEKSSTKHATNVLSSIHIENVDKVPRLAGQIMEDLVTANNVPLDKQILLFTHIRLAQSFSKYEKRLQCVQARLQAISVLVYSNAMQESLNVLLYNGFIEELVDILEVKNEKLMIEYVGKLHSYVIQEITFQRLFLSNSDTNTEIKAAALRTLTSIIHLERNPKLNSIIDATGASSYHGFLPVLVRTCIQHMTESDLEPFPQPFATALFSFLYHLASYEGGGEALVACGMMESLLKVVNWYVEGQEHITFVTRAVRVVDLITNLDMQAFQTHSGIAAFINRLENEVECCRKEQPFVIRPARSESLSSLDGQPMSPARSASSAASVPVAMETDRATPSTSASDMSIGTTASSSSSVTDQKVPTQPTKPVSGKAPLCYPQRAALLKSMLNFLKKAIPDPAFSESIRHLMDGSLPRSLKHIISNAEYYGPSLFLLATDVVTVYIFQEPSLLSSLQDNGLTDVVLHALLVKDVPATREVLASLPNVFSALCLNARGLEAFVQCKPFDRLFKVLLSPDYLPAMRRRRSSDPPGDTASNLGSAMDELMRHQPSLRIEATKAIIKLLEEVCGMGKDPKYVCQKPQPKTEQLPANIPLRSGMNNEAASSDSEDEEDEVASTHSGTSAKPPEGQATQEQIQPPSAQERIAIPLMDYVLNVMKFVEAILSNNTTDDHCREFVNQNGLDPLMSILGLPNLPVDFPASPSCQAVAAVCKSILTLSHDPNVLRRGLLNLNTVLDMLEPLHKFLEPPGGSVLLRELANAQTVNDPLLAPKATPLLHSLAAAHAYITMFTHVCKVGQSDIRSLSVSHWGAELGLKVLQGLSRLYTSLVWESTVLLAFCSEDILPQGCEFGKSDLEKIVPKDLKPEKDSKGGKQEDETTLKKSSGDLGSNGVSAAMESLSTSDVPMETDETSTSSSSSATSIAKKGKLSPVTQAQIKQIKLLLSTSSRLGRALAELFGLLVKLSVGSPVRQRRFQQLTPAPTAPTPAAKAVATALTKLLANGLSWVPPPCSPVPKLRLTFFICSVGFTSPMLFDEKKYPYHLMLQKFLSSGGQEALFEAFRWALSCGGDVPLEEGLEYPSLPDGTGEFLDAWLMLVEKMVNTKSVMESPHTLPAKATQPGFVPFDPLLYLIHTHKMAFSAVMYLWNKKPLKVYGGRMSESILAILCHIIKGEAVIKEKSSKEKEKEEPAKSTPAPPAAASAAPAARHPTSREEPEMYQENLQQLMDMGFSREHCAEALANTASLEQATEYCLTHPPPPTAVQVLGMDLDLTEEDQVRRAIAMSLDGDHVLSDSETSSQAKEKKTEEPDDNEKQPDELPLEKLVIDDFTETMFPGCMQLLDSLPETVYRVCDLITVVTGRNGDTWRDSILSGLLAEIAEHSLHLMDAMTPMSSTDTRSLEEWANHLSSMTETSKLAVRLHLLSLLFEEMKMPCAEMVEDSGLLELLVRLLNAVQQCLVTAKTATSPKWMTPLILLLDQYEKMAVASKRKAGLDRLTGKSRIWKWFDDRSGRWYNYSTSNNKTIDDAYQAGESNIRFTAGRKRYTVQFSTMIQINEDSHNRRPVMLSLPTKEEKEAGKKEEESASEKAQKPPEGAEKELNKLVQLAEKTMETDEDSSATEEESLTPAKVMKGLMPDQISSIIRSAVGLIEVPVDADSLHAVMRLTLRLTREHEFAVMFSELGGAKLLLNLTQASGFQGSTSLITLIFRHILEEARSLMHTVEKVVRSATSGTGSSASGVAQGSMGSKELNYILRVLGPVACRCPEVFTEVAKSCLRIALPPPAKRDEDEARLTNPNTPQLLKCLPSKPVTLPPVEDHVRSMVCDLLNTLAVKYTPKDTAGKDAEKKDEVQEEQDESPEVAADITEPSDIQQQNNIGEGTGNDETSQSQNAASDSKETAESIEAKAKIEAAKEEAEKKRQPLLPKSAILRLLAELVRSYAACAQLVTQHNFQAGQTELVTEDCGVLAFILDHLLPQCQTAGDKDCPALARVLIACIASCNHNQDAQALLGCEIKGALQRALNLPESTGKHAKIQALTGIISIMIESCPAPGQVPNQVFKGQQSIMNNMVRVLLRKGLVNDLARIPHSLDLASPNMVNTINAALKPLETLSRIVNQPQSVTAKTGKLKTSQTQTAEAIVDEPVVTEGGTHQGDAPEGDTQAPGENEIRIQDVTGNEIEAEGLDETVPLEAVEPPMDSQVTPEEDLEEVLDQLLERDTGQNPENSVLGEILMESVQEPGRGEEDSEHAVVIDVEVDDADDDVDQHDSQMVTQDISDDEVEDDTTQGEHEEEGGSEPDGDDDDDDNEDDEEGDDDDEDEEEEEDDEDEGSDMEADDDEYQDIYDEPFSQRPTTGGADDDLYVQLEELLPTGGTLLFGDSGHMRSYQLPVAVHDADNANDVTVPAVPPAPSNVTATHPLLIRHAEHQGITGAMAARVHRAGRQRGTYRFNPSTQTLHLHYTSQHGRHPNPPAILQRLLGPSAAADVLQLTNTLSAEGQAARLHFVTGENLRLIGDEVFEELFQDPFMDGDSSSTGVLASVPSALSRWTEEARVLDGDSMHDGVTVLKPSILGELEKHRDAELVTRKEKRKKAAEEEAAKKEKNGTASKTEEESKNKAGEQDPDKTIEWENAPGAMEVGERLQTPSSISTTGASTSSAASTADGSTVLEVQSSTAPSASGRDQADQLETLENTESLAEAMATAVIEEEWPSALQQHMLPVVELPPLLSTANNGAPSGLPQVVQWSNEGYGEFPNSPPVVTSNVTATTTVAETPAQAFDLLPPSAPPRQSGFMIAETPTIAGSMATIPESITPTIVPSHRGVIPANLTTEPPHNAASAPVPTAPMETGSASSLSSNATSRPALTQDSLLSMTLTEALRSTSPTEEGDNDGQEFGSLMGEPPRQYQVSDNPTDTVMPEQPSDITSSDAVTVHSSGSNSETPSVGDIGTPSGEPPVTPAEVLAASLAASSSRLEGNSQGTSANNARNVSSSFADVSLPDGVDPSFLAALPDNIRQEVIGEQLRLQRIQERAQEQRHTAEQLGTTEVSADFLAALPPSIQEEVLAQQRSEQARLATTTSRENPEVPVDPAGFIQSLPPTLRQQVLADMDDSMVAVLPSELATEANTLRRELEDRHRRIMQDRLFFQGAGPLSALLRHSGLAGRLGSRYTLRPPHSRGMAYWNGGGIRSQTATNANTVKLRGRYLLDHEALTCLLVLLFVDEPKLNSNRLHRVLRNLCYHAPTRTWVLRALLSMLHRTSECKVVEATEETSAGKSSDKLKRKCSSGSQGDSPGLPIQASSTSKLTRTSSEVKHTQPSWLSISLDAALGCRASVFQIPRSSSGKKHANTSNTLVTIHPQASPVVCRHVLDTLISLAKSFPNHFLPHVKAKEVPACKADGKDKDLAEEKSKPKDGEKSVLASTRVEGQTEAKESCSHKASAQETDFWELLVRLDSISSGKKGKGFQKLHVTPSSESESLPSTFEASPLGQLMTMLSHPVVRRSQLLTDRLLRLLGLVSTGLPDLAQQQQQQQNPVVTTAAPVTTTAATTALTSTSASSSAASTSTTVSTTTTTSSIVSTADQTVSTATSNIATAAVAEQRPSAAPPADQTNISRSMAETTRQDETLGFSETMDISTVPDEHLTSTPLPGKKEEKTEEKKKTTDEEEAAVLEQQLQLAVEVLTSKSCSEEGLEDATNLLLQLSRANNATRDMILGLLLGGARHLGLTVCTHIRTLLCELQQLNSKYNIGKDEEQQDEALVVTNQPKGVMQDRFQGGNVVVHVGNKVKASGGRELRVPSMSVLTNKNASQQFLLRILKVIIQLRQAARLARLAAKKKSGPRENISSISAAMAMIEAETEAIMEMVGRRDRGRHGQSQPTDGERPATEAGNSTAAEQQQDSSQAAGTATAAEQQPQPSDDSPMEVDQQPGSSTSDDKKEEEAKKKEEEEEEEIVLPGLSDQLQLEELWEMLGECLTELAKTPDNHAVLVLQPTVEAFFLVHAGEKDDRKKEGGGQQREDQLSHLNADLLAPMSPASHQPTDQQVSLISRENSMASVTSAGVSGIQLQPDTQKFLKFADTHRTVLNHILRQSTTPLADGPFAVLVDHTRVLDFDVKRRFFRQELDRMDEGTRRENLAVHVRREHVFEDSFRELHRRTADEWKHRLYIVFEGEEGQDAGGLLREWYLIMSREIFNPMYALFMTSPGDRVTYTINPQSHINSNHLSYYKFVGRFIAKAIYDNKLLECYFTRSFYKHMLGVLVKYMDMESEDYAFYQGLVFLLENDVSDLGYDLAFSTEVQEFGVTEIRDLKPNGRNLKVSEENKREYMKLVCQEKMTGAIRKQLNAFLEGFYDVIPKRLIAIFNEQELELLISGLPTIDIDDLKANTEYHKYQVNSLQVQWFWRALRSFDQADRARFLQFVTGTSKVPLQGFAHLEGMNGTQKFQIHRDDRSTDRLPSAHTCFNQLDLPAYETYDKLKHMLLTSCNECSEGFGLA